MTYLSFQSYLRSILNLIHVDHFAIIGFMSMAMIVCLTIWKKYSVFSAIALGIAVFFGFIILDTAVLIRFNDDLPYNTRYDFAAELTRLIHGNEIQRLQIMANFVVFIPFGFFLSKFLSLTYRFDTKRQISAVLLAGFALSLFVECLQLVFRVGLFEITDLVMNTVGAFVGALLSAMIRVMSVKTD